MSGLLVLSTDGSVAGLYGMLLVGPLGSFVLVSPAPLDVGSKLKSVSLGVTAKSRTKE